VKSLQELGQVDRENRLGEFSTLCRLLAKAEGRLGEAAALAETIRSERVRSIFEKASISAGGGSSWGAPLSEYRQVTSAFLDSLRWSSAFFRMYGDGALIRLPFRVRVGTIATAAGGGIVEGGAAIAVQKMALDTVTLDRQKAAGIVVLSRELLGSDQAAEALITRSLRGSVSVAVDTEFVAILLAAATAGNATADPLADLVTAFTAIGLTDLSRPYVITSPAVAITLSTFAGTGGNRVFPGAGPLGGELLPGLPLLVTDAMPATTMLVVDAAAIGGASDGVEVEASRQAAIEMSDAPTQRSTLPGSPDVPIATTATSMWQTNAVAVRAIAYFGAAVMRSGSVAAIEAINW
jgi:HK97 family phage major capsid protein